MLNQKITQLILKKMVNKETLEEVAERLYQKGLKDDLGLSFHDGVKIGAEWQKKQMEKLKDFDTWKEWKSKL